MVEAASTPDLSQTAAWSSDDMLLAPDLFVASETAAPERARALLSKEALWPHLEAFERLGGVLVFHDKRFEEVTPADFWCVFPSGGRDQS